MAATLYRIDEKTFKQVKENPDDFKSSDSKGYETFEKTFDGLRFVIAKGQSKENAELAEQIFYPGSSAGDTIDYASLDFDTLPDDTDLLKDPVFYNDPAAVKAIAALLNAISVEDFKKNFDPDELNRNEVYPEIWNRHTEENAAFNERSTAIAFELLKDFYAAAMEEGDYVLSFVG